MSTPVTFSIQPGWAYNATLDALCTVHPDSGRQYLYSRVSDKAHNAWVFEIDVLTSPGGNSGVFYDTGNEFQVISATHPDQNEGKKSFGAVYGSYAPTTYPAYPGRGDGLWNRIRIKQTNLHFSHSLNGVSLLTTNCQRLLPMCRFDSSITVK